MKRILLFCFLLLVLAGCRNSSRKPKDDNDIGNANVATVKNQTSKVKPVVNVYIENSGSMDGYVNGKTEFKDAIRDLLVLLKYYYDERNVNIFFINSDVHSATSVDLSTFADNINTLWYIGDRAHSKLNNIFKQVLQRTNNQTISILFSDYIYSIAGRNTSGLLSDEKSLTKDAFLSKWKKNRVQLATNIVKMSSRFKGEYYPYTGDQFHFSINMQRPYYICIIGNQDILNDFNKNIEIKAGKISGFENKYVLSSEDPKGIYYSVLNSSFNKGRFKIDRKNSGSNCIHGIADVSLMRESNSLTFAVAVDFRKVLAENDYICNAENYEVATSNFNVVRVFAAKEKEISKSDWITIKNSKPTHIIILESIDKKLHNTEVRFVLKKQIPQWVSSSSAEDDTEENKLVGKTFGLKYWVEGIAEAYEIIYPDNRNYFECTISIK